MTEGASPDTVSTSRLMGDAQFLRDFIQRRGLYSKEVVDANKALLAAIEKGQGELATGHLTAETEISLLTAMSDALRQLKCSRLDDLRQADSLRFRVALTSGRLLVFATMFACITLALPLTLAFNQLTTLNKEIEASLDEKKAHEYVAGIVERDNAMNRYGEIWEEANERSSATEPDASEQTTVEPAAPPPGLMRFTSKEREEMTALDMRIGNADLRVAFQEETWQALTRPPTLLVFLFRYVERMGLTEQVEKLGERREGSTVAPLAKINPGVPPDVVKSPAATAAKLTAEIVKNKRISEALTYLLNNAFLPLLYGMLGAAVFLSRRYMAVTSELWASNPLTDALMRIGLGGMAGLIVGWFQTPEGVKELTTTPFALAFIAGFSIDIVFSFLERIVSAFDFRKPA